MRYEFRYIANDDNKKYVGFEDCENNEEAISYIPQFEKNHQGLVWGIDLLDDDLMRTEQIYRKEDWK